ncbi:hypothetical protein M426DRAFT_15560 [Hypoxylon sp. CI-4A]|nr:hypothetical protein M426DRAFT_15560 [Hypoxylon sp. CI-4A]
MSTNDRAPPVKAQKTERSHEENQERAYIAASRRADRSLEARVQSARQASEIHRRRTGRGLKVSEEIVLKEEMYEEEEDDIPRHYKYLTAHLQTNSRDMNHRVNAYITTQAAMATMARYNEVNRLFSESFPTAMSYQQSLQQNLGNSMYMSPLMNNEANFPHRLSASGSSTGSPATRTHSVSSQPQFDRRGSATTMGSPVPNSATTISSPPALTPASSTDVDTSDSKSTPYQTPSAFPPLHLDPQLAQQSTSSSVFTSELSNDVKMMANIDMNDPMAMHFMGDNLSSYQMFGPFPGETDTQDNIKADANQDDNFMSSIDSTLSFLDMPNDSFSRLGTPAAGTGSGADGWENFVDFGSEQ